MTPAPLMTLAEVAAYFRLTPDYFGRQWRTICRERGFPQPVQGGDGRAQLLWSPLAIRAWEISRMPARLRALAGQDSHVAAEAAALEQTYGVRSGGVY